MSKAFKALPEGTLIKWRTRNVFPKLRGRQGIVRFCHNGQFYIETPSCPSSGAITIDGITYEGLWYTSIVALFQVIGLPEDCLDNQLASTYLWED